MKILNYASKTSDVPRRKRWPWFVVPPLASVALLYVITPTFRSGGGSYDLTVTLMITDAVSGKPLGNASTEVTDYNYQTQTFTSDASGLMVFTKQARGGQTFKPYFYQRTNSSGGEPIIVVAPGYQPGTVHPPRTWATKIFGLGPDLTHRASVALHPVSTTQPAPE